jgi:kynurenine formamidase
MTETEKDRPSEAEALGWFQSLSNWGRWGPDDQKGTLNWISPEKRLLAAGLVRSGRAVSCSRTVDTGEGARDVYPPPTRMLVSTGSILREGDPKTAPGATTSVDGEDVPEVQALGERFEHVAEYWGFVYHGTRMTHLDSLGHIFWDGHMYNGFREDVVTSLGGTTKGDVLQASDGIVTRGILLDIARLRGVPWIDSAVTPQDLEAAEAAAGIEVGEGDALLIRTGQAAANLARSGYITPGWDATCLPWLYQRRVALISADTAQDSRPSGYPNLTVPIHSVGIVAMGLWLLDYGEVEELAAVCEQERRWEFMFITSPIPFRGSTGSPVNPLAIF